MEELEWFRQEIRKAYGGRAPRVLDPFAGGGAIPLEAMRLGCEVTAVDINPVAWFILKCTLEYPQKLAGKTHPLPDFILEDEEFMAAFYKAHPQLVGKTRRTKKQAQEFENDLFMKGKADSGRAPEADLAWHVRAWGKWVLDRARRELACFYPTYADFEPLKPGKAYEKQSMRLVPLKDDGTPDIDSLNAEFSEEYLADRRNPRWVAKPTVAYLWARTVTCKNCRATVPLLKTRWLCKKDNKRVLLTMEPNADKTGVVFGIEKDVPVKGGNAAQTARTRQADRRGNHVAGRGTVPVLQHHHDDGGHPSRRPVRTTRYRDDRRGRGRPERQGISSAHRTRVHMARGGREGYRPTSSPRFRLGCRRNRLQTNAKRRIPLVRHLRIDQWKKLFTPRQLLALGTFRRMHTRAARDARCNPCLTPEMVEAIESYLALGSIVLQIGQFTMSPVHADAERCDNTFSRFALPIHWDFF